LPLVRENASQVLFGDRRFIFKKELLECHARTDHPQADTPQRELFLFLLENWHLKE